MNNLYARTGVALTIITGVMAAGMGLAFAVDPTPSDVVTSGTSALQTQLLTVAQAVLPVAAVLLAVGVGWRFARKVIKF